MEEKVDINNVSHSQAVNLIWNALNKASKAGVYTIDECVLIRKCMDIVKGESKMDTSD